MCCRRYKNSLSEFVRKCKDCSLYMSACSFIQQTVVSSSRCYVDFLFTDHIVEFICIHTSCIYHIFCLENALIRVDFPDIFRLFQFFYFCIKLKFYTIFTGIFCHRNI